MWFLALFTVVVSGGVLALSAVPGVLEQVPNTVRLVVGGPLLLFASGSRRGTCSALPGRAGRGGAGTP